MIGSNVHDTAIEQVQQLDQPNRLQVRIRGGSRPETIDHLASLTRADRLFLRLTNALKVKIAAYGLSAVVALVAGQAVQNMEREVTGYSPLKREQLLQRKASARNAWVQTGDPQQQDIGGWFNARYRIVTQAITNPKEFIENSETYQSLLEKYYNTLKVIDLAAFLLPAILLFLMLGGYIQRRVNRSQDDVVGTEERERLRSKINEVIDATNRLNIRVDQYGRND